MGIVTFVRHEWTPTLGPRDPIRPGEKLDLAISLARVVVVNGRASHAGSISGSFFSLMLESQLLATALDNTETGGVHSLRRSRAFDCSSLHIKSFVITSAGLGLLTASLESLIIQERLEPFQVQHFDLMPATTPKGPSGGNSRPDLLINLPDGRLLVGEAKGRRNGSERITQDKRKFLKKLHAWTSSSEYEGCPLALSWASILEDKTIVSLFHTDPDKDVEPVPEDRQDHQPAYSERLVAEPPDVILPPEPAVLDREWEDVARNLTEVTLREYRDDPLFWSAPEPLPENHFLAGVPIRGEWSSLGSSGRSIFVGVFKQPPEGESLVRIRRAYAAGLERNAVSPLDVATEGRLLFAIAQNRELATWRALRRTIEG
ncbi:hypothetical protein [Herbidospora cretacea]|uniref:hypothetical protein n=1 Tax=Herbidospora cretacea TaxID=28444 RepID=UPI000773E036|nr:hypothetical protein [Herbidospora cretacea]